MKKRVLVFGGTADARRLAEELAAWPLEVTVSVAGAYGASLLEGLTLQIHTGRLTASEMAVLLRGGGFGAVVDATHPYAHEASVNIRAACEAEGLPCLRLLRPVQNTAAGAHATLAQAVGALAGTQGNILAATGSKELQEYLALPNYATRVYPRVLPLAEALEKCYVLGFTAGHVIAMQGPFSTELNVVILRQFNIRWLVTKDGGAEGGFAEKREAAERCGAELVVVGRPPEQDGLAYDALLNRLRELLG